MNAWRARVLAAEAHVRRTEAALHAHWPPWRTRWLAHRTLIVAVGGFAAGIAAATVPPRWWLPLGRGAWRVAVAAQRLAWR